jgi:hypothetical protein
MPVTDTHPLYDRHLEEWELCRDVLAGERAVKDEERRERYIPKLEGHKGRHKAYETYVEGACLYGGAGRTFDGLRGLIERNDPDIVAPDALQPFLDDATGSRAGGGISVAEFSMRVVDEVLRTGRCGVLTDFSAGSLQGATMREAEASGRRVFWKLWTAESIRKWWTVRVNGVDTLVKMVLRERVDEDDPKDEFGTETVTRYRVLDLSPQTVGGGGIRFGPYRQRVFERQKGSEGTSSKPGGEWVMTSEVTPLMNGRPLTEIPWVFVNAKSTDPEPSKPPLLDLCSLIVKHFRNSASLEHGLLLSGSPTPYVLGYKKEVEETGEDGEPTLGGDLKFRMGGGYVWTFREATAVDLLSIGAEDLSAIDRAMEKKEAQAVVIGARMLTSPRSDAESGKAKEVDLEREHSSLATVSKMCSKGLTRALEWARDWSGASGEVSVALNTDFFGRRLDPSEAETIVRLWQEKGAYAKTDCRRLLRRGEYIDAGRTDEEIDRELEQEAPPGFPPGPAPEEGVR